MDVTSKYKNVARMVVWTVSCSKAAGSVVGKGRGGVIEMEHMQLNPVACDGVARIPSCHDIYNASSSS